MMRIECPQCKYPHFTAHLKGDAKKSLLLNCMNCYHKIPFNRSDSA